jgi:hypothetical protein
MSRPEAAFMWPSAAAWVSGLRLALFGHRPLAEHMRAGLRRVTRRAYPRWGMLVTQTFASWNQLDGWLRQVDRTLDLVNNHEEAAARL